ncbi:unnamed protein product [Protopolystoma xenopodis]|uniref:Uncharacterized protein n=1 Tax=Protopolystoma xenopodis TaxID=117903 RepID=A0A448WMM6_9PLAT|nr:unnamed protein product [Protopolystoma xenopodis]
MTCSCSQHYQLQVLSAGWAALVEDEPEPTQAPAWPHETGLYPSSTIQAPGFGKKALGGEGVVVHGQVQTKASNLD